MKYAHLYIYIPVLIYPNIYSIHIYIHIYTYPEKKYPCKSQYESLLDGF